MTRHLILILCLLACVSIPAYAETIVVPVGGNFQAAINVAQPGDAIVLQAGAEYVGTFSLPEKPGASYIVIQSSAVANLPIGVRVSPANAPNMATIRTNSPNGPAIFTNGAAHHYRFVGIRFATTAGVFSDGGIIRLGSNPKETSLAQLSHDFDFDRCYVHGQPGQNVQQGFVLNAQDVTVQNSYVSEIHYVGTDSQAILSYNSPGGIRILNNYLEGAGENILIGGADPGIPNLVPGMTGGIEIRRNHIFKPLSWKVGDPSYAGFHWTVKNLLELKNAKNVTIDGNVIENNWVDGQAGIPVLFTVRNQECTAPNSTIQNVTFTNNTVRNAKGVFNFLGKDNEAEPTYEDRPGHVKCSDPGETFGSVRGSWFVGSNNLFYDISGPFLTLNGFYNITLDRNTHVQTANLTTLYKEASTNFKYTNNLTIDHDYGIYGDGGLIGVPALERWTPGYVMVGNVIGGPYGTYPPGNIYPASLTIPPDWRSPFPGVGCDIDALNAAQSGSGNIPTPSPTPSPVPTVSPTPTPTPTPTPAPSPTPAPTPTPPAQCQITAPASVNIPKKSSGTVSVTINNAATAGPVTIKVIPASGQVTAQPNQRVGSGSSIVMGFLLTVKQNSSSILFESSCGNKTVQVIVN